MQLMLPLLAAASSATDARRDRRRTTEQAIQSRVRQRTSDGSQRDDPTGHAAQDAVATSAAAAAARSRQEAPSSRSRERRRTASVAPKRILPKILPRLPASATLGAVLLGNDAACLRLPVVLPTLVRPLALPVHRQTVSASVLPTSTFAPVILTTSAPYRPVSAHILPISASSRPVSKPILPESVPFKSESATVKRASVLPVYKPILPASVHFQPESSTIRPASVHFQPESSTIRPVSVHFQPASSTIRPVSILRVSKSIFPLSAAFPPAMSSFNSPSAKAGSGCDRPPARRSVPLHSRTTTDPRTKNSRSTTKFAGPTVKRLLLEMRGGVGVRLQSMVQIARQLQLAQLLLRCLQQRQQQQKKPLLI